MKFAKTIIALTAVGFLAACEGGGTLAGASGGSAGFGGSTDTALIAEPTLVGKLDSATQSGNAVVYAYFTDVVGDGDVLTGADKYCGGAGQANIQLTRAEKAGRAFHTMAFTCR